MSLEHGAKKKRHHNPVDSICRKIKSIQMLDQVSNPAMQIPKFQSRNFDSPQSNIKKNLEEILKRRTFRSHDTHSVVISPDRDSVFSPNLSPCLGPISDHHPANATFIAGECNERSRNTSIPVCPREDCSPLFFGSREVNSQHKLYALPTIEPKDVPYKQKYLTSSPNLYFFTSGKKPESAVIQPPLSKIFPSNERGKVAVSKIIDYLRHTTSRGSEDSDLDELCNMLDPDQKDVSMDLKTYHAVMGEWIEDRKRKWEEDASEESSASMEGLEFQVLKNTCEAKKAHARMNVTSGSLEAFGGDVSRGDMETSDLITCVADLQYNNQKLQEENNKLKLTLEAVDETSNKLLADNEDLRQQIKSIQHSVLKAKALEEELEETKNNLNLSEEKREQILLQNKQLEKENQSLNSKVTSLQEENIRNSMDTDGLHKKILELSKNAAELQVQAHIYESTMVTKEASLIQMTKTEWTSLDETLDREVLLLLQGPEYAGEKFKTIMQNLQEEASEAEKLVMTSLQWVKELDENIQQAWESKLMVLKKELGEKTLLWIQKLQLLEKCKDSLDKDFVRMAGNLRRTKTEQIHLKKELSARQQKMEAVKQLQEETAGQAEALGLELQKTMRQLEDASRHAEDQVEAFHSACEENASLKCKLEEAISEQEKLKDVNAALTTTCQLLQEKVEQQKTCLDMEQKSPKGSCEEEEDVPTSVATEKNSDKDLVGSVSGENQIKNESSPVMDSVSKQDPEVEQEKKINEEQSEEAPAVVPVRKGSSPTAGGIKGDKAKSNEPDSPNEKEVEAEFLRLSLGFKCDLFTLDKRVRLEERSRDLAEENLKKEIMNAVKMLEALVPLCEEDNQAQEIIKKLQKSLQFLSQYAARVASRAEMLGAINQESRVSKAVEVMIQHVENLKRMYAKEHAELEELKQVLLQNERSFSSLGDRDESTNKKLPSPFNFKPSAALRRVSIATLPRSAGNAGIGLPLAQFHEADGDERSERFNRRSSSWGRLGAKQNEKRPSLQRFLSTYSWAEYEEEYFETKQEQSELPAEVQEQPTRKESVSEKGKHSSKWTLESAYNLMSSWASHLKASFSNANKTLWFSVSILVLLAALTSFLTGLSLQRPADAAPVGTGDSWMSLQQLLWPYTGLQHNGPPPV
ncbi:PREDICTED: lymphoid-restricted membrane protein [Acanthisitta chloris]|nr:PREDICTED: lymphoid-restricted membrane protein [Acanthisitta chloris]